MTNLHKAFEHDNYQIMVGSDLIAPVAQKIVDLSNSRPGETKHISLLGGSTVFLLFKYLVEHNLVEKINWEELHLWWNDERLVPHEEQESNFGELARQYLADLPIPEENLHRFDSMYSVTLRNVEEEIQRMHTEVERAIDQRVDGFPSFDLILLGVGDDGHTASLFPRQWQKFLKLTPSKYFNLAVHPDSYQLRISQSLNLINAAQEICFVVAGANKASAIQAILPEVVKRKLDPVYAQGAFDELVAIDQTTGKALPLAQTSPVSFIGLNTKTTFFVDLAQHNQELINNLEKLTK